MAASPKIPSVQVFRKAFLALGPDLTPTRRRILEVHYRALDRQLTMTQIAQAVGWSSYSSANSHYGRLAKLMGEQTGFRPLSCHLAALCTLVRPEEKGDHWLIIMRKEVAAALESLGWFSATVPAPHTAFHLGHADRHLHPDVRASTVAGVADPGPGSASPAKLKP